MSAPAGAAQRAPAGAMVKLRVSGTRRGCAEAATRLHRLFYVSSVSQPYPQVGSSRLARVYVRARLDLEPVPPPAAATRGLQ
jgi:hypothetical protein